MSETTSQPQSVRPLGLGARLAGIVASPRETFASVVAHPRWLVVALVVIAVTAGAQMWFQSTEVGRQVTLDETVRQMESFGIQVSDEMYEQTRERIMNPPAWSVALSAVAVVVFSLLIWALIAGVAYLVFGVFTGGSATYRQVFAVVVHAGVITAVAALVTWPLSYLRGARSATNLGVFLPFLAEDSFLARLAGMVDLFLVWWLVVLSIGLGVAFRKKTGGISIVVFGFYALIAIAIAAFQAARS